MRQSKIVRTVWCEARKFDPEDSQLAAMLLGSAIRGPNADLLAGWLGIARRTARGLGRMLRAHGLWSGRRVVGSGWFGKDGGVAFCLDLAVARGWLERVDAAEEKR